MKATKGVSLLKYLSKYVSRKVLDLSYKLYVRPHLDYGDVIYHNQRADLMNIIEQVQYKAALIVSGCWQGTNRETLYDELGWESLSERRWSRRMTMFYKILNGMAPPYLSDHLPDDSLRSNVYSRRNGIRLPFSRTCRHESSFVPFCIKNWNNLDNTIKSAPTLSIFKTNLIKFVRPKGNTFYSIRDRYGAKLLTKIRVSFSDLRDHRFNHNFNCLDPTCRCGLRDETTVHFFLCCPRYKNLRTTYLSKISDIVRSDISVLPNDHLTHTLMYGSNVYNNVINESIISETIYFINKSGRFVRLEAFS